MRTRRAVVLTSLATLALTSCAAPEAGAPAPGAVSVPNCDREVVVEQPPQRAVSLNQSTTEIMLSLGLQDRMVGTATWTDPVDPDLAEANARVPRLADNAPSFETVLSTEPDIVLGAYQAVFTDERVASRERFGQLGVPTYLSPSNCLPEEAPLGEPVVLEDIYREVREIATLFGVPERGEALIADLRDRVSAAQRKVAGLDLPPETSVLFWFARTETPYVAGGTGAPAIMARTLGVRGTYADQRSMWPQIGWEDILARNPSLLVLGDLTRDGEGDSLRAKVDFLRGDPAVSRLPAVREQRWLPMTGTALNVSLQTIDGIEALADALVELDRQR
ncbi:ABC transporter substrate-binding protein [Saccharopolyspora cebuensis]|uniref:ABC transporter substrate-binding protein n=1 Tax=Saccharopolyspora cebuensis TaxID=418759 RepID=A0ABV4CHV8_9PSEU